MTQAVDARVAAPGGGEAATAAPRKRKRRDDFRWKLILLLPAVLVVLTFTILPLLWTLGASFTDFHLFLHGFQKDVPVKFVGLNNWIDVMTDQFFWHTAKNTIVFSVATVALELVIGLAVALSLRNITRGQRFFRVWFLLPLFLSPVAVGMIVGRMIFHEAVGPVNDILRDVGFAGIPWLSQAKWAMFTLIMVDVWQNTSFMVLLLYAGLMSIPDELYEAAKVDGASDIQGLFKITLPLLAPVAMVAILIKGLDAFKVVDIIKVVTGGGPGNSTESLTLNIFDTSVRSGDISVGAAGGFILLGIMTIFVLIVLAVSRRYVSTLTD